MYFNVLERKKVPPVCKMLMAQELPSRCITNAHRAGRTLSVASASAGDVLQGPQQFVELLSVIQRAETVRAIASLVIGDTNV